MNILKEDKALFRLLERNFPSAEKVRQYLYSFHEEEFVKGAADTARFSHRIAVPPERKSLKGLQQMQEDLVNEVAAKEKCTTATVDFDADLIERAKTQAQFHQDDGRVPQFSPPFETLFPHNQS